MKELRWRDRLLIDVEQDGARQSFAQQRHRQEFMINFLEGGPAQLYVIDLKPLAGDSIKQVLKEEVHVVGEVERAVGKIDAYEPQRLLLSHVVGVHHVHMKQDQNRLRYWR